MSAWNRDLEELAKNCVLFMAIQFMQIPVLRVVILVKTNLILVKYMYALNGSMAILVYLNLFLILVNGKLRLNIFNSRPLFECLRIIHSALFDN